MIYEYAFFKVPKKIVKEMFLQEQLYVEDLILKEVTREIPQEEPNRGVIIIDIFTNS